MKKLITMIAIILMMTIGAISAYGAQDSAVADEPLLLPEATVFIPGLPEGVSLTMTNVYNYYMEHSSDGNPIYWIIVQRGGTVSSNTELRKVFQYIYPNGGGYKPGDPSVVVRPQEPDDVNRVTSGSLLLYYTPENSNYQIRVAIFCVDSIDVGDNSFWRFANLSGGELGQGGIKPLSKLFSEPLKSSDVATTQFGAANDGVVFPKKSNNRVPADAAPYIYFGAYDHISRLEQPTSNRSATTYTQADIKREGFVSPILWQVDDVSFENDRISLSSEYVIDTHVFNGAASSGNDYRTSDIRTWLNGDFITQAFASEESGAILPTDVEIKLYDFNSLPLREVEPAETSRIAYGDKVYLPDMPSDGAPLFQKDNGNKGAMTWTRTWTTATQAASGDHAFSSMLGTNGTATVTTNRGIAPLTALKYSSVLYLSEISAMAGQGKTVADAKNYRLPFTEKTVYDGTNVSYFGEEAVDFGVTLPAKYYKLTLLSPLVKLTSVLYNGIPIPNGNVIEITNNSVVSLTAIAEGHSKIAYKIVQSVSGERKIVGYGEGSAQDVSILAKDLSGDPLVVGGDYALYVWAQKDNAVNSNEGSAPAFFKIDVQ